MSEKATQTATALLRARPSVDRLCYIYPTDGGGLLLEFVHDGWDYAIEIQASGVVERYGVQVHGPASFDTVEFVSVEDGALTFLDALMQSRSSSDILLRARDQMAGAASMASREGATAAADPGLMSEMVAEVERLRAVLDRLARAPEEVAASTMREWAREASA